MKHDLYWRFGVCWNDANFSPFSKKTITDITYTSYDYFYKLKGKERLFDFFTKESIANKEKNDYDKIDMHRGYCQKTNSILKSIKECCIMVRRGDMKSVRIVVFTKRFGKITSIAGLNPEEIKSIRDIKIRR